MVEKALDSRLVGERDLRMDRVGDGHASRAGDNGGEGGGEKANVRHPDGY